MIKPFFKWPGSKHWLISRLETFLPQDVKRIVEPFAGSASFFLGSRCNYALLSDANQHVVDCLSAVRDSPQLVIDEISRYENIKSDYIYLRNLCPANAVEAAARIIFLTNTSWGGLYRENRAGMFNVPFGNNGRAFFCKKSILDASQKLRNSEIFHATFDVTLSNSFAGDLIFIDAPYVTKVKSEYFDRYHSSGYAWSDQLLLSKLLRSRQLNRRKVLITCAADENLYHLFPGWGVIEFSKRNSMTAYKSNTGNRKEALLFSPALTDTFIDVSAKFANSDS